MVNTTLVTLSSVYHIFGKVKVYGEGGRVGGRGTNFGINASWSITEASKL